MKKSDRKERLMPDGVPRYVRCYDYGPGTGDRYTVVFTGNYKGRKGCDYLAMNDHPFSPQGIGLHQSDRNIIDRPKSAHLGRKIRFENLPVDCQRAVIGDYCEIWGLEVPNPMVVSQTKNEPKPMGDRDYVRNGGNICPYCGSREVSGVSGVETGDDGIATQFVTCGICGKDWDDVYKLVGYRKIEQGEPGCTA